MAEAVFGGATTPNTRNKIISVPKDLRVIFDDGQVIEAHALILILASDIFRELLTTEDGSVRHEIALPGKVASEFEKIAQAERNRHLSCVKHVEELLLSLPS